LVTSKITLYSNTVLGEYFEAPCGKYQPTSEHLYFLFSINSRVH